MSFLTNARMRAIYVYIPSGEYIPEACSEAASPILFVAQQPSVKIILDPTKRHKCLFHGTTFYVTTRAVLSSLLGS